MSKPTVYVLFSGGIDSTACLHHYRRVQSEVRPVFVDYGQPARTAESSSAKAIAQYYNLELHTLSVHGLNIPRFGHIMGRNSLLVSAALMHVGAEPAIIALGIHSGTRYFDCGLKFVQTWDTLLTGYADGQIQLGVPFLKLCKADIIAYSGQMQLPLQLTWSCESSSDLPCGQCLSCRDREEAKC
jgi:7-cyano-7-deazaguanine synthase